MSDEGITCPKCGSDDISFTLSLELTGGGEDSGFGIDKLTCDNCGFEMPLEGDSVLALSDLVEALNAIGVKPSDLIAILQALKAANALQAELVLM